MPWYQKLWRSFTANPWAWLLIAFLAVMGLMAVGTTLARFFGLE